MIKLISLDLDGTLLDPQGRITESSKKAIAKARAAGVRPEDCTVFDDSLAACQGARAAGMRVVGVHDGLFAHDETEMRGFCDVYIKSFEELLWIPERGKRN